MSTKDAKFYVCVRDSCSFKTGKRKAIYTHLVRTHAERKEDYECEYCSAIFQSDSNIEQHLQEQHPSQPFTYTCVSRIENVINKCAKLGQEHCRSPTCDVTSVNGAGEDTNNVRVKTENSNMNVADKKTAINSKKAGISPKQRTKASVNASLHNIAKTVENNGGESLETSQNLEGVDVANNNSDEDADLNTHISKPSGLKIKLNLKKIAEMDGTFRETSKSPPFLEPEVDMENSEGIPQTPPDIVHNRSSSDGGAIREKASKYFDKLEVYHTTDEFGRRCCPFCPYKTTKNTIRVHLSGIHKVFFVKCSLCDYKAAFPHQITQHGVKFHKTTNLNVIQLSKVSRETVIERLPKSAEFEQQFLKNKLQGAVKPEPIIENDDSNCSYIDDVVSSESCSPSEEEDYAVKPETEVGVSEEERFFKPPKCQTSKTDYYNIQIQNGVYMYCCKLCPFQTPVRATIYTHKYRHEEKSYQCGYCQFTSSPRSNVVHHCRSKHKHKVIKVIEGVEGSGGEAKTADGVGAEQAIETTDAVRIKQEPADDLGQTDAYTSTLGNAKSPSTLSNDSIYPSDKSTNRTKASPTIIKVPQFKRSFTSTNNPSQKSGDSKKRKLNNQSQAGYKLSLNKLYRINPVGSPKFLCVNCPYACDTHPQMKHHLYRHRPQQYKCPYCEHRKYPRSYVVRHVRDTHRGKLLRVIDLSKENGGADMPGNPDDVIDDVDQLDDTNLSDIDTDLDESMNTYIHQDLKQIEDITNNNAEGSVPVSKPDRDIKLEPAEQGEYSATGTSPRDRVTTPPSYKTLAGKLQLNLSKEFSDKMFTETPDVSPNFSDTVYTSTPIIESIINNGQFPEASPPSPSSKTPSRNFEKKKSLKDYRINAGGQGPRYSCNTCGYGTENYKTIHNHMYRHESQRYQCPYCGYRRSPRSFVENHIREVHKGNPVIVTELTEDVDGGTPKGSPRQCVNNKRKSPFSPTQTPTSKQTRVGNSAAEPQKIHMKWPAPKPAANVLSAPKVNTTSPSLQIPVKNNLSSSGTSALDETHVTSRCSEDGSTDFQATEPNKASCNRSDSAVTEDTDMSSSTKQSSPFRFKEGSRTTFKTMYKCVFDPESCNHISKDKSKMKQHLFMHVEYKPWTCDLCEMTASQSSHIKNHVRSEHQGTSEMSFKYKRHNYLEKHIDGFLTKGLFTVPVSEYRRIMDLKGNTKTTTQKCTFGRDADGFILCPYCDYKTQSGGMTDHVKMKHMQPRFKCHWCDFRAFYRSEVRKHHRKEKSHAGMDFKTQELDLSQLKNGRDETAGNVLEDNIGNDLNQTFQSDPGMELYIDEYGEHEDGDEDIDDETDDDGDEEEDEEKLPSNCDGFGDISDVGNEEQSPVETQQDENRSFLSTDQISVNIKQEPSSPVYTDVESKIASDTPKAYNTAVGDDVCMKIIKIPKPESDNLKNKDNKFQCGYCTFSATLRVKVKMHCSKKHSNKMLKVLEPNAVKTNKTVRENSITRVDANDWKGTKFEQDLKKAGVSKLNLTSLFPVCKRFKIEDETLSDTEEDETDSGVCYNASETIEVSEQHNHYLTIPFKKALVPKNIDIPVARHREQEPEFKIPLKPSPNLRNLDKYLTVKRAMAISESGVSIQDLVNEHEKDDATLKQDFAVVASMQHIKTETPESPQFKRFIETNPSLTESDVDNDIIVAPLESAQCESIDDFRLCKENDNTITNGTDSEVSSEVKGAWTDANVSMDLNINSPEASEKLSIRSSKLRTDPTAQHDVIVLKTMPNLTPVVLENEAFDDIDVSTQNVQVEDMDTITAKSSFSVEDDLIDLHNEITPGVVDYNI